MGGGRATSGGRNAAARTGGGGGGGPNTASGISYIKSGIAKQSGDVAVEVSVAKLNSGWKKNPINYIPKGGDKNTTGKKYGQAKEFLSKNKTGVKMPEISVKNGVVTVRDGRHRTAVLRDTRKKTIFITVKRSQAAEVKEKFGAK